MNPSASVPNAITSGANEYCTVSEAVCTAGAASANSTAPVESLSPATTCRFAAFPSVTSSNAWVEAEIQQTLQQLQAPHLRFPTNQMRLPNETPATKTSWEVVVRYGRLYPLYGYSAGARDGKAQNAQTIEWQRVVGQGVFVEPRREQGNEPESGVESMVRTFQRFSKTNYYFVFWVYEDSFAAFNRAKETAASLGFQYGWDPVARNTKLKLGERGTSIPPQN